MHAPLRRLYPHPRGRDSCGLTVDCDGSTIGPDHALVLRTPAGFRPIAPPVARALQAAVLIPGYPADWLYEQCQRIADALSRGELALAQIYGLQIPIGPDGTGWPGSGSSGGGAGHPPPVGAGGNEPASDGPPMEYRLPIPAERPATAKDRYAVVRRTAEWLRRAAALGALAAPEPRVKAILLAIEGTAWLVEYPPEIRSYYLDRPKNLSELQAAVDDPQSGYEIHHIVEGQYNSTDALSNARRFGERLEKPGEPRSHPKMEPYRDQ